MFSPLDQYTEYVGYYRITRKIFEIFILGKKLLKIRTLSGKIYQSVWKYLISYFDVQATDDQAMPRQILRLCRP